MFFYKDAIVIFKEMVREKFKFLSDYGYAEPQEFPSSLEYPKSNVLIVLSLDKGNEVCLHFSLPNINCALSDLLEMVAPGKSEKFDTKYASSPEKMSELLNEVRDLLLSNCHGILEADAEFVDELQGYCKHQFHLRRLQGMTISLKPKISLAQRDRNYGKVVKLYAEMFDILSPGELDEMEYAKRQLEGRCGPQDEYSLPPILKLGESVPGLQNMQTLEEEWIEAERHLLKIMRARQPILDEGTRYADGFLQKERDLLRDYGWTMNTENYWQPFDGL